MADFDSVIHMGVARDRASRRKQLKVGNTGTSGYRAPEVRIGCVSYSFLRVYSTFTMNAVTSVSNVYVCMIAVQHM